MSLLELDHVTIRYGQEAPVWRRRPGSDPRPAAVSDATFRVEKGDALGIVGESGSGKTTIMRAVMGFVPVDEGEIRFDGEVLGPHRSTASRRAIQMVFQDPGTTLNPTRRVGDAIEELLRVHRIVPDGSRQARVRELFDRVRLPSSVYRAYPRELSGGQKQRVAIARSLALQPQILIADEATSALDVIVQASVLELLQELRADSDITLISIAHDLNLVRYLCDRAIVMNGGRIVESGPVDRLFDHPQEPYTRELIDASPQLPDFARIEAR